MAAVARFSRFTSVAHEFSVTSGQTHEHDFIVSLERSPGEVGEAGRIVGTVTDSGSGTPVEAAVVGLADRGYEAVTNAEGRFVLENVPAGPQRLELRHLAYGTQQASIEVRAGSSHSVQVEVTKEPVEVEPLHVTITGTRDLGLEIRGFYERQEWSEKLGLGHFFTTEDIERRRPRLISHMIADLPSTRLDCSSSPRTLRCELSFVGIPRTAGCQRADIYIDGVNVIHSDRPASIDGIDELVRPVEIAGVEVYPSPASMPAEFSGASGSCGAIVIWTR